MTSRSWILVIVAIVVLRQGCTDRFDLEKLSGARADIIVGDTSYVEIVPPFEGFNFPRAIMISYDQLMYVADTRNNRIVMMNVAGQILGTRQIVQPMAITQDLRLDLLITGLVVESNGDSVAATFRIKLVQSQHNLGIAEVDTIWRERSRPLRRFVGIAALPNNEYLVTRQGPDNSSFVDPDSRVLFFDANDRFITPLGDLVTRAGSGITDINKPTGISAFPSSRDFVILQSSEGVAYGAIWMVYQRTNEFEGWLPKFDPAKLDQRFVDFVRPNRYVMPQGVTMDGKRRDVFVADMAQDSVFKFDSRGNFKSESFGFTRSGGRMRRPSGVAFFDKTLYVSDIQTNQIFRFRLSTDFQ